MTPREHNRQIRTAMDLNEAQQPGTASKARRAAVYAVATGHELGLDDGALLALRDAALLGADANSLPAAHRQILELSRWRGSHPSEPNAVPDREPSVEPRILLAFRKVERLIQPVEEPTR